MNISWEYAKNYESNEQRWQEMSRVLQSMIHIFCKNTMLQMTLMSQFHELLEVNTYIQNGDRSEFLYNKAKEMADQCASLEKVGEQFTKVYLKIKNDSISGL